MRHKTTRERDASKVYRVARRTTAPEVFLDTGFVIALLNRDDPLHALALRLGTRYADKPRVTTTAVLVECGDGFADRNCWPLFAAFLADLLAEPTVTVVDVDRALLAQAAARRDTREPPPGARRSRARPWGLTDCISFVVMDDREVKEALTADRHFREAGFRTLLVEDKG